MKAWVMDAGSGVPWLLYALILTTVDAIVGAPWYLVAIFGAMTVAFAVLVPLRVQAIRRQRKAQRRFAASRAQYFYTLGRASVPWDVVMHAEKLFDNDSVPQAHALLREHIA